MTGEPRQDEPDRVELWLREWDWLVGWGFAVLLFVGGWLLAEHADSLGRFLAGFLA